MMTADFRGPTPPYQPPPQSREIDALTTRVKQLEDRVRWIEAQVEVERVRREKDADGG